MFKTLKDAWKIADLRKKILYTLMIIVVFRLGSAIPVPYLDSTVIQTMIKSGGGNNMLGYIDVLTGGAFSKATIFALSISPYITASIVIQLLAVAIPSLEKLSKEGEEGRKVLMKITRWTTIALGLLQALGYYAMLSSQGAVVHKTGSARIFAMIVILLVFTAGTALIMWLGERINEKGIGNGISLILFAGIVSRGPAIVSRLSLYAQKEGSSSYIKIPLIVILFLAIIVFVVWMTNAERRIPIQYAKRVVGRKMYGGQSSHIPIKVNMSGVMPIIFASSLLMIPSTIQMFVDRDAVTWFGKLLKTFNYDSWIYAVLTFILIIGFSYFYVSIQYNPMEMANNLRKSNGTIPGIRPGKPTADFIAKVMNKITFVGALFLGVMAILPFIAGKFTGMQLGIGGTTILIVVGVALDTVKQIESLMMMRHYKGFLV